jgi:hypothetical protein
MKPNKLTPGTNLKWESSRMMLPEHVEALRFHHEDKKRKQRPDLDEQELMEIDRMIRQYIDSDVELYMVVFGEFEDREIKVKFKKIDPQLKRVKIEHGDDFEWFAFEDILEIYL